MDRKIPRQTQTGIHGFLARIHGRLVSTGAMNRGKGACLFQLYLVLRRPYASSQARKDDRFLALTFLLFISPPTTLISKCNSYFRTTQGNLLKSFPPKMAGQGDDDVAKQEYKMSGEWVENGKTSEFTL
jgi:hypothetical protein